MAKQVTLTLKSLEKAVAELESIKDQITAHAGTASQRLQQAKDAVLPGLKAPGLQVKKDQSLADARAAVSAYLAQLDQQVDEAVTAHLRKSKDDSAEGLTALRESFKSKAEAAVALQTILVSIIPEAKDVTIPTLKGTGRVGTGGSSKANSKGQQFYRVVNGTRHDSPSSQNKFSSVAWYYASEIGVPDCDTNKTKEGFKGCSAKRLEDFLKSKGVDVSAGKAWSFEASPTFTIGMDVTETEAAE